MPKINVLDPSVFNMISAGEVVERPASVVKELVENSIDAGATSIDITIEDGGLKRIQISDDGIGIAKEDLRTAFLPHATSKLTRISDLDTLSSLGFRGEALASIASVSEVTLVSRAKNSENANRISISGGKVVEERVDSRAVGTIITVDNLFFNTPARLKFMKSASAEQKAVLSTVQKLVLANPNVSVSLYGADGALLTHEGGDLLDAITSVYGIEVADKLEKIDYAQAGVQIKGYTSRTDFTKPTRTWQTYIVNGRAVENKDLSLAIDKSYEGRLVKHNYPVVVLEILLPFDEVDINVHPRKSEVRFRDKNRVFSAVYHAIGETLDRLGIDTSFAKHDSEPEYNPAFASADSNPASNFGYRPQNYEQQRINTSALYGVGRQNPGRLAESQVGAFRKSQSTDFDDLYSTASDNDDENTAIQPKSSGITAIVDETPSDEYQYFANSYNQNSRFDGKIVGQIFDTYVIVERDGFVYVIDQHAAHERVLYEKIAAKLESKYVQQLLVPYKFKLTEEESEYFEKILPSLNDMGFDVEKKFGSYYVYAVPEPVSRMDVKAFMNELFKNMLSDSDLKLIDIVRNNVCQQACKAAIKGGDALTREQIEELIVGLMDENGKLPDKCPHGRPAIISFTKKDVEKAFKRIV